jgi:hypothetical protein
MKEFRPVPFGGKIIEEEVIITPDSKKVELLEQNVKELQGQLNQAHIRIGELSTQVANLQNKLKNSIIEKIDESV